MYRFAHPFSARAFPLGAVLVTAAVFAVACTPPSNGSTVPTESAPSPPVSSAPSTDPQLPSLASQVVVKAGRVPVADAAVVAPGSRLKVRGVPAGSFVALHVTGRDNRRSPFPVTAREGLWVSDRLPPRSTFELTVDLADGSRVDTSVVTSRPPETASATISPSGGVFGVGMPVTVRFPQAVPDNLKAAVESNLVVDVNPGVSVQTAGWGWVDDQTVVFRPKGYWPAGSEVAVTADLTAVEVAPGVWGRKTQAEFSIGREMVFTVDGDDHTMTVRKDGRQVRSIPVSLGKAGWETTSGVKVISEVYESKRMVNSTGPETWDVVSPYAMRLTYTGEFLHGAPWNPSIGAANTSHGCTNVTVDDGRWLYERVLVGDVVEFADVDGAPVAAWNGLGGVWNIPWSTWRSMSALPVP